MSPGYVASRPKKPQPDFLRIMRYRCLRGLSSLAIVAIASGCSSWPSATQDPKTPQVPATISETRLFGGKCLKSGTPVPHALPAIALALAPAAIGKGLDLLEAAIRQAGEQQNTPPQRAQLNLMVAVDPNTRQIDASTNIGDGEPVTCLQFVHGRMATNRTDWKKYRDHPGGDFDPLLLAESPDPSSDKRSIYDAMGDNGIYLTGPPDIFLELRFSIAKDASAIAFSPNWLIYNRSAIGGTAGFGQITRDLVLTSMLSKPSSTDVANPSGSAAVWQIAGLVPGRINNRFDATGPQTPWIPIALDAQSKPWVASVTLVETKNANQFLVAIADVIKGSKQELQTTLENQIIPEKRQAAATAAAQQESDLNTAYATALTTAMADVDACLHMDSALTAPQRLEVVRTAYLAQSEANAKAVAASRKVPFGKGKLVDLNHLKLSPPTAITCPPSAATPG